LRAAQRALFLAGRWPTGRPIVKTARRRAAAMQQDADSSQRIALEAERSDD